MPPTSSHTRNNFLAIGTIGFVILVTSLFFTVSKSHSILVFIFERVSSQLKRNGFIIELHEITPQEVTFSLSSKVPHIELKRSKALLKWHAFLPALEMTLETPVDELGIEYLDLEGIRLKLQGWVGLFQEPEVQIELHSNTYELLHKKSPYPLALSIFLKNEALTLLISSEEKKLSNHFEFRGKASLSPFWVEGQMNGIWGDAQVQGPLFIKEESGTWQGHLRPAIVWKQSTRLEPNFSYQLGSTASATILIAPESFKSDSIKLTKPIQAEWSDDHGQDKFLVTCPEPCLSITLGKAAVNLREGKIVSVKAHDAVDWKINGLLSGIASPALHRDFLDLKTKEIAVKFSGNTQENKTAFLKLQGKISEQHTDLILPFRLEVLNGKHEMTITTASTLPLSGKYQPSMFLNRFRGKLYFQSGSIQCNSTLVISDKASPSWDFDLGLHHLEGIWKETPFREVNVKSQLQLYPVIRSKSPLTVSFSKFGKDLVIENFLMKVDILDESHLKLLQLGAHIADGKVTVDPFAIDLNNNNVSTRFKVEALALGPLLKALLSNKLQGQGKLNGEGIFGLENGELVIPEAQLTNSGKGVVRYLQVESDAPGKKVEYLDEFQALLEEGHQALVFKALENFHYDILTLKASRTSKMKLSVNLHLKGRNPDLANGQLFEINLPVSGQLESLILNSILQTAVEEEIDKHQY